MPLDCPRYLFNLERVGESRSGSFLSRFDPLGGGGFDFSKGSRDTFFQGKCDDTIRVLARKCGWEVRIVLTQSELDTLHGQTLRRLSSRTVPKVSDAHADDKNVPHLPNTDELADQLKATKLDSRTDPKHEKL